MSSSEQGLHQTSETHEEDFDTDLEEDVEKVESWKKPSTRIKTTKEIYEEICNSSAIVPASKFVRQLSGTHVDLKHYGVGDMGAEAVAMALEQDFSITTLNLHDNCIHERGTKSICRMLGPNCFITHLDLSGNRLGKDGFYAIGQMLRENISLLELNLGGCHLHGKEIKKICESLKVNVLLKTLLLSYNNLGDIGASYLGTALATNAVLEFLDISWNGIKVNGARALARGLRVNKQLQELDFSWNGFLDDGADAVGEILSYNTTLKVFDISSNGIHLRGVQKVAKGLQENRTLQVLKIGRNPLQSSGACYLLKAVQKNPLSALQELQLDDIVFDKPCEQELNAVLRVKPDFMCSWGVSITGGRVERGKKKPEVWELFFVFVRARGWRLMDIFKMLTKEADANTLTLEDFLMGMKRQNIPMRDDQLRELFKVMDKDRDGVVDFTGFSSLNTLWYSRSVKRPPQGLGPPKGLSRRVSRASLYD